LAIGLGYLTLGRETSSLSGGESQRVKLVRHLGSSLTDLTYIFDEPSIGLHPNDIQKLNKLLIELRNKGNTVLIVEHDPDVIAIADHIVDMGIGAGNSGGNVVYSGSFDGLLKSDTLTGKYLKRQKQLKTKYRKSTDYLFLNNTSFHNLRNVSVQIPRNVLTVVTGVAGSGKSSLVKSLERLCRVGLDYIVIGQSLNTFSGGERQRLKLATELGKKGNVYVFDEPTGGLHGSDVSGLMELFEKLVDDWNTVIIIEHNPDVVSQADWIIDMGPGAGKDGGKIIFEGYPKDIIACNLSLTGKHLGRYLNEKR
jgi:excinuclease UvrABC ATPase subunit